MCAVYTAVYVSSYRRTLRAVARGSLPVRTHIVSKKEKKGSSEGHSADEDTYIVQKKKEVARGLSAFLFLV